MIATIAYKARRLFTMKGRRYLPGDPVVVEDLPNGKAEQLVAQRVIELASIPPMAAARPFTFAGRPFLPGDDFPLDGVTPEKRMQLLEHRFIQPQAI